VGQTLRGDQGCELGSALETWTTPSHINCSIASKDVARLSTGGAETFDALETGNSLDVKVSGTSIYQEIQFFAVLESPFQALDVEYIYSVPDRPACIIAPPRLILTSSGRI
jgi:hypothetical protein